MSTVSTMPLPDMDLAVSDALSQLSLGQGQRDPGQGRHVPCHGVQSPKSASAQRRSSSVRVGIDLVTVADVAESVQHFGDRYLNRIFTPHEIACCRPGDRSGHPLGTYSIESLAARFAAKEAVVKVLRPQGARPEWRSIEVRRTSSGWCGIRLSGQAASQAADAGIDEFAVSLTHESMMAAAVVVGVCRSTQSRPSPSVAIARGEEERWTRPFDLS